jgi:hypothetical protein
MRALTSSYFPLPILTFLLLVPGCTGGEPLPDEVMCADGPALVSGTIVRVDRPRSFSGPFEFNDQSMAKIELRSHEALGGDGISEVVAVQIVRPVSELPLSFCVAGDPAVVRNELDYTVSAVIKQYEGQATVGDLVTEYTHLVLPPAADVVIEVSGLEECGTPDSGGFCL